MKVFLTGATGFIGSHLVPELLQAGHEVIGMTRSEAGVQKLAKAGAKVYRGDLHDRERLHAALKEVDGVVHLAFDHDFSRLKENSEDDRNAIAFLGEALADSDRPLLVTSGTEMVRSRTGSPVTEHDGHVSSAEFARAATEEAADELIDQGRRVIVIRLPQVHDTEHQGRIAQHIQIARQKGRVCYVGDGKNRVPAVHVSDAASAFRLALEKGRVGSRYHVVAEEGVSMRSIVEVLGAGLQLPVQSIPEHEAKDYFGVLSRLAALDLAASGVQTQTELDWRPRGRGLLTDLKETDYVECS